MKLGAEPKKIAILGVLVLVGGYSFYTNVLSTPGPGVSAPPPSRPAPAAVAPPASGPSLTPPPQRSAPRRMRGSNSEFRPALKPRTGENRIDPTAIDPTLRFDLLAKVQAVDAHGGGRNLFQFGTAPPPPMPKEPEPKIIPTAASAKPSPAEIKPAAPAGPPPPPPIPLKYYGYSTQKGEARKRAFFLDGEEILVAGEGDTVKRGRYRVVRIGVNSVVMEDTEHKSQQTLPLAEDVVG